MSENISLQPSIAEKALQNIYNTFHAHTPMLAKCPFSPLIKLLEDDFIIEETKDITPISRERIKLREETDGSASAKPLRSGSVEDLFRNMEWLPSRQETPQEDCIEIEAGSCEIYEKFAEFVDCSYMDY